LDLLLAESLDSGQQPLDSMPGTSTALTELLHVVDSDAVHDQAPSSPGSVLGSSMPDMTPASPSPLVPLGVLSTPDPVGFPGMHDMRGTTTGLLL
jgi:hypothetical protein